jgi:hypothetical protein
MKNEIKSDPILSIEDLLIREVAQGITYFPKTQNLVESIYRLNKYTYYSLAVNSPIYQSPQLSKYNLATEVSIRNNIGVLLAAQTDDSIFELVKNALFYADPRIKNYIKHPRGNPSFEEIILNTQPTDIHGIKLQYICHFITYVFYRSQNDLAGESHIFQFGRTLLTYTMQIDAENTEKSKQLPERAELLEKLGWTKSEWKFLKSFTNADVITKIRIDEAQKKANLPFDLSRNCPELEELLSPEIQMEIISSIESYWDILLANNICWSDMFAGQSISRDEQTQLLLSIIHYVKTAKGLHPSHYVSAYIVYVLGKEISNMRQFYWDHNEESQYLENHQLGEDKRRLENEVNILKHKIKELTSQINQLEKNQRSLEYHAVIPFKNKISYLENIIAEQDRELTNLRANANELSKLRALATTSEESNISRNDTAQLADISKEKRIIVIGGHTNWRNNLGFDFPELQLIDGTTASFDFRTLETADYIIFYTYNMAHTVYEKAISYVRNKSIPYGYLPRITNPTLVAEQILNIILKEQ